MSWYHSRQNVALAAFRRRILGGSGRLPDDRFEHATHQNRRRLREERCPSREANTGEGQPYADSENQNSLGYWPHLPGGGTGQEAVLVPRTQSM